MTLAQEEEGDKCLRSVVIREGLGEACLGRLDKQTEEEEEERALEV